MNTTIKAKHVIMRAYSSQYINEFKILLSDLENLQYTCLPRITSNTDISILKKYFHSESHFSYIIFDKQSLQAIGYISLHTISLEHKFCSVTFLLCKELQNKGIMTDALYHICMHAFQNTVIQRIEGQTYVGNINSNKLLEKLGFIKEGVLRNNFLINGKLENSFLYALLKSDFQKVTIS